MLRVRGLVGLLTVAALLAVPQVASSAPPAKSSESFASAICGPVTSGAASATTEFIIQEGAESSFQVAVWTDGAEPFIDSPRYVTDWVPPTSSSLSGGSLAAASPVYDLLTFEVAGTASVVATVDDSGDRIAFDERFESGNWFTRTQGFVQFGVLNPGLLTIDLTAGDDLAFDLAGCDARYATINEFGTQPSAFVDSGSEIHMFCRFDTTHGEIVLDADAASNGFVDVDLFAWDADLVGFAADASVSESGAQAVLTLFDLAIFEELPDPATLTASFQLNDTSVSRLVHQTGIERVVFELYAVSGTLEIPPLGLSLDLAGCSAFSEAFRLKLGDPQGPQGKPLGNDAPAGATPIRPGQTLRGTTVGSVFAPERVASCTTDPIFGEEFLGNTIWFSLVGTGGPLTIDTAGSQFDTAFAVYAGGAEVACADNVATASGGRSLQAATTIATEAGVTYLIQLGGVLGEEDRYVLAVR